MAEKHRIRLGGTGGQGIIKGAMVLAEAGIIDGKNATQTQVYGPESRGGATKAEVNISDEQILFPLVSSPNIVLCLSIGAWQSFTKDMPVGSVLILDSSLENGPAIPEGVTVYRFPMLKMAYEDLGNILSTNIVALGVLNGLMKLASSDAVERSISIGFKKQFVDGNIRAYEMGCQAARDYLEAAK